MNKDGAMPLLACFAAFWQLVAEIRVAARIGCLDDWLAEPGVAAPADAAARAARVQARLLLMLERQRVAYAAGATSAEQQAYRAVQKVMAAVADEALLLELAWDGSAAWPGLLLEVSLFRSRNGGSYCFELADRVLRPGARSAAQREVAAVLLMALQLGFQGCLRGAEGAPELQRYRAELFKLTQDGAAALALPVFGQAYANARRPGADARLAPLAPWRRRAGQALLAYLLVSAALWFNHVGPVST